MLKHIYFSSFGFIISVILQFIGRIFRPFMVYGYWDKSACSFRKLTRISSTAVLSHKDKISIGNGCWIWHHSIIDGSNGVIIGDGVQIGAWVGIFTHSSHLSIRLVGDKYIEFSDENRVGYVRASVNIGDYTFIASNVSILPGVKIGKGCIITAGSVVAKDIPDYSIATGNPARCVGSTLELDKRYFSNPIVINNYYDPEAMGKYLIEQSARRDRKK